VGVEVILLTVKPAPLATVPNKVPLELYQLILPPIGDVAYSVTEPLEHIVVGVALTEVGAPAAGRTVNVPEVTSQQEFIH
jgi:hypothetical protein